MHLHYCLLKNFRRLKHTRVDLEQDTTILVGANNSGKTSIGEALRLFAGGDKRRVTINDFNTDCWLEINQIGAEVANRASAHLPRLGLDLWLRVSDDEWHLVSGLLPSLEWSSSHVGLRIEFAPVNDQDVLARFDNAVAESQAGATPLRVPTLVDYLTKRLSNEYDMKYYRLDRNSFDEQFEQRPDYTPSELSNGKAILDELIRVDFLDAQRHSSEVGRAESLSRRFGRYYKHNLEQLERDPTAFNTLLESEVKLNEHLNRVFEATIAKLSALGYPGLEHPQILVKTNLDPETVMNNYNGTKVHYRLNYPRAQPLANDVELPDTHNGLGFRNLIYMAIELLDLHADWMAPQDGLIRPLHLIFIEEPEAHLHVQLQQVFIRQVRQILTEALTTDTHRTVQLVVTTHSPHILYERGFSSVRYFRRRTNRGSQTSEVLNLAALRQPPEDEAFLERYLKLTHCDLFFADAAILVEGNVERLLMPAMIEKAAPRLQTAYVCILEIGGAFGHKFRSLIEFLSIPTLIVTDIDSTLPVAKHTSDTLTDVDVAVDAHDDGPEDAPSRRSCPVATEGAVTSNQVLRQWLPRRTLISELLHASDVDKTQRRDEREMVRVVYQTQCEVSWNDERATLTGRTLEEAFALENLDWCQDPRRSALGLRLRGGRSMSLSDVPGKLHGRVQALKKTDFALALLAEDVTSWCVPRYISDGLRWLASVLSVEARMRSSAANTVESLVASSVAQ